MLAATSAKVLATPAVRRLCREMSIDLSLEPISGTGPGGRVLKGDVLAYAAKEKTTSEDTAEIATGVGAERGGGHQSQQAGQNDLSALLGPAKTPAMAFHGDADRLGSLSRPASEPVARPALDWSSANSGADRRAPPKTGCAEKGTAAGVQVVVEEEEQWTPPRKEARRPGVRERKEPVSVPIKGEGDVAANFLLQGKGVGGIVGE